MLKNYLLISFRAILKDKWFSLINILGLAIGLAAFWLIQHYVVFERSYEHFVESAENVYRVQLDVIRNGQLVYQSSENYAGVGEAMKNEYPEVIEYGRFYNMGSKNNVVITWEDAPADPIKLRQKKFLYADASVLSLLSYEMINGDRQTALVEPFTIVVSESMARKYFGEEDPMGKFLRLEDDDFNDELCKVTGVFKDSPENTHLKFDVLISFPTIYTRDGGKGWAIPRYKTGWGRKDYYTYVKLEPGTDPQSLESKLPDLVDKFKPDLKDKGGEDILKLQPLTSIHLGSRLTDEPEVHGSEDTVFYLSIISWFIIVIAWINYVNLSTAKAVNRAKEVGLRKVMGSQKRQLIFQFLTESMVINAISLLLGMILVAVFLPLFSTIGGTPPSVAFWTASWFWISAFALFILGSLVSGIYPAFVLSSYRPIATIKGQFINSEEGVLLRKGLVVLQFATSIGLIIGTSIVYDQMSYMQDRDLGFNMDQKMIIQRPAVRDTSWQQAKSDYDGFRNALAGESAIKGFASVYVNPGTKLRFKTEARKLEDDPTNSVRLGMNLMDYNYIDLMEMELAAGRNFSKDYAKDADTAVVVNEASVRALGFASNEEAIGKYISLDDWEWKPQIVGVIKDFHQETLQEKIIPIIYILRDYGNEFYVVKMGTGDLPQTVEMVESHWQANFDDNPMNYFFLDEYFNTYYEAERQFRDLFVFFAVLAVVVGCLGLFGLSLFNTVQRSKEIGIRKVLGASAGNIVRILVSSSMKLVLIANLIAWPLTYYFMEGWLENYPYKTDISVLIFIISSITVLLIAFVTVGAQTLRSAQTNPAEVLKYE